MAKTLVLMDGHVAGHHEAFLDMFVRSMQSEFESTCLIGPGAEAAVLRMQREGISVKALKWPGFVDLIFKSLRLTGCSSGTVFYLSALLTARWELRKVRSKEVSYFLPYVYEAEFGKLVSFLFRVFGLSWGGLCSEGRWVRHPEKFEEEAEQLYTDKLLIHENLSRALHRSRVKVWGVLDEMVESTLNSEEDEFLPPGAKAIRFPEFVSEKSDQGFSPEMRSKILDWAGGRKVVSIAGALKAGKGLVQFLETAKSQPEGYCFVIAGRILWDSYLPEECALIQKVIMTCPSVYAFEAHRLPDEYFNAAISASDILLMRYRNWTNSSNMLSQAVKYKVPVIVESGFLLADRVQKFQLGWTVDSSAPAEDILPKDPAEIDRLQALADWEGYRNQHRQELFEEAARIVVKSLSTHGEE